MKTRLIEILSSIPMQWFSRLLLGGLFVYASIDKIAHPRAFADILYNYQILPDLFITIVAITLPWVELFSGFLLVLGFFCRTAAIVLFSMLLIFIGAISFNLIRGLNFDCGCFTTAASGGNSDPVGLLIRDILLLLPGMVIIFFHREKKTGIRFTPQPQ